jgi:hypothetical protein
MWGRVIRYRKVFFATDAQMAELAHNLSPFDILRAFSTSVSSETPPVFQLSGMSTFIDLSKGQEAIYAGMHTNCRYKVRRAEKMHDRFEIVMNSEAARRDFLTLFNDFARSKKNMPLLKPSRFKEYLPHADVFVLYLEGQPTCGRLVLRDEESGAALMLYSGTRRFDEGVDTITIGLLNRYLHWHEMKTYQEMGIGKYDLNGVSNASPFVSNFKMSFGGELSEIKYCVYAGTARPLWKLAHSLYLRFASDASTLKRDVALANDGQLSPEGPAPIAD